MYRYGDRVIFRDYFGVAHEGPVKERLSDGSYFIEVNSSILPDIASDVAVPALPYKIKRGVYAGPMCYIKRQRFPNWQAWVKPEWIAGEVEEKVG